MAEAIVKFSLKRLKSLLLQESKCFVGLENQAQTLLGTIDEISCVYDSIDQTAEEYLKFEVRWFHTLRDAIFNTQDYIDEFILQMENQTGSAEMDLIHSCRIELQKQAESLVQLVNKMSADKEEKEAKDENEDVSEDSGSSMVDEDQASSSTTPFKFHHINIPYYLRSSLMYCCMFPEKYEIPKGRLVRLLAAEGLVQEKPGEIVEDIAEENIKKLVEFGLLHFVEGTKLKINEKIHEFMVGMTGEEGFFASCTSPDSSIPLTTRRLSIHSDPENIPTNSSSLPIQSLFMFGVQRLSEANLNCLRTSFQGRKFLRALDLEGVQIGTVPDEIGNLIHLRYLSLKKSNIDELPESVGNLRSLQTLDITWNRIASLSNSILNLVELRHLKMFKNSGVCGVRVPVGIGSLGSLQTITGVYPGGGIAAELGQLTQLRKLGIMDLTEDDVHEVLVSIMKMPDLRSLSLRAKSSFPRGVLPSMEPFTPPTRLQMLRLEGRLEKLPDWFSLMENLHKLRLGFSGLSEDPSLVLQFLPNLKHLTLWHAYDATKIGKEFCGVGGFPKLEVLVIASRVLEEWIELEAGAMPNLKCLNMHNCLKLRMLPEGLQNTTKLKQLKLLPLRDDLAERLKPDGGEENYKISHIPCISFITNSAVQEIARGHPAEQLA